MDVTHSSKTSWGTVAKGIIIAYDQMLFDRIHLDYKLLSPLNVKPNYYAVVNLDYLHEPFDLFVPFASKTKWDIHDRSVTPATITNNHVEKSPSLFYPVRKWKPSRPKIST